MEKELLPKMDVAPVPIFKNDKSEEGWELARNVEFRGEDKFTLELVEFPSFDKNPIRSVIIQERVNGISNLAGQSHAERILAQRHNIPKEWRIAWLVFMGTIWKDPNSFLYIPCLRWHSRWWRLHFRWLSSDFLRSTSLLVLFHE